MVVSGIAESTEFNTVLGAFIKPVTEEYGWNRSQFVGALSLGTLLGGLSAAFTGPLLDRFGPRWLMFTGFLLLGGSLIGMAFVNGNIIAFYVVAAMTRIAAQGLIGLSMGVTVTKWFVRQRGRATAISNLGTRSGVAINPFFVQLTMNGFGWKTAMVVLGVYTWVLTLVPTALFLRRQPEDMGLLPDGDTPEEVEKAKKEAQQNQGRGRRRVRSVSTEQNFTLKQATRTKAFYFIIFATGVGSFANGGINLHFIPLLTDEGLSRTAAVSVLTVWSAAGFAATFLSGFIADRFPARYLVSIVYLGLMTGIFILSQVDSLRVAVLFAIVHGTFVGSSVTFSSILMSDYFGRRSIGAIRGFTTPFTISLAALGPLASALVFDSTGSYTIMLVIFMSLQAVAAVSIFAARQPSLPASPATA